VRSAEVSENEVSGESADDDEQQQCKQINVEWSERQTPLIYEQLTRHHATVGRTHAREPRVSRVTPVQQQQRRLVGYFGV